MKRVSMSKKRLLNGMRRVILSPLSLAHNNGICHFCRDNLVKPVEVVVNKRGNAN
jgi:hypothetical protein